MRRAFINISTGTAIIGIVASMGYRMDSWQYWAILAGIIIVMINSSKPD